jgi:hypothetical protein
MMQDPLVKAAELSAMTGAALTRHQRWALTKKKLLQLLGGLIMEKNDEGVYVIAIGRVSWWMAFLPAIGIWIASGGKLNAGDAIRDISPNHFNVLVLLAGYNFGKKITDTAKIFITKKRERPTATNNEPDFGADGPG